MARDDPESPGQGDTECHQGPGGAQGNPGVGTFPQSPAHSHLRPCSVGGQPASTTSSGNGSSQTLFQADTPENVQRGVSESRADSKASHGPYFMF